jgi:hypothetical protein
MATASDEGKNVKSDVKSARDVETLAEFFPTRVNTAETEIVADWYNGDLHPLSGFITAPDFSFKIFLSVVLEAEN